MRVMENDVYRHMKGVAEGYKARTGRDFWEDLRSEAVPDIMDYVAKRNVDLDMPASPSPCNPDWIKRYFKGEDDKA